MAVTHPTYAQAWEDLTLWQLVGDKNDGFYIDIGANDPVEHSVSKSFYDAGWRGINIEPLPHFARALMKAQPESATLRVGVSDEHGYLPLWTAQDRQGWSTFDPEVAKKHKFTTQYPTDVVTLASICGMYELGRIDWMKIDVEGYELQVLKGGDWQRWRPDFLCIESVFPGTETKGAHTTWEPFLLEQMYDFVREDNYNRYYKRAEL